MRAISRTPTSRSPGSRSISRPPTVRARVSGRARSGPPRRSFPGGLRGRGGSIRRSALPSSTRETAPWTTAGPPTSRPASNATRRTSSTPARRCIGGDHYVTLPLLRAHAARHGITSTPTATPGATRTAASTTGRCSGTRSRRASTSPARCRSGSGPTTRTGSDSRGSTGLGPRAHRPPWPRRRGASSATPGPTSRSTSTASTPLSLRGREPR